MNTKYEDVEEFFEREPTLGQEAWGTINDFCHELLTYIENNGKVKKSQVDKIKNILGKLTPKAKIEHLVKICNKLGLRVRININEKP